MAQGRRTNVSVMMLCTDGSVAYRRAESTSTAGLVIVADCASREGPATTTRHVQRQWQMQTTSGYLVGDMSLPSRSEAHAASEALGSLDVASLSVSFDPELRSAGLEDLGSMGPDACSSLKSEGVSHYEKHTRWGKVDTLRCRIHQSGIVQSHCGRDSGP